MADLGRLLADADGGDQELTDQMNGIPKYVVSNTLKRADWNNTTIISGDIAAHVAKLKEQPGGDMLVYGSPDLVDELLRHQLVDEYRLLVYPVILGSGKRMFRDRIDTHYLRLVESRTFTSGVVLLRYVPDAEVPPAASTRHTSGPTSRCARCRPPRTSTGRSRPSCSPTSSTRPGARRPWATARGRSSWSSISGSSSGEIQRWHGQNVEFAGDGVMAVFDAPTRALRCAFGLVEAARDLDIETRVGIHTGEIERRETGVGGIAVHIAARVLERGRGRPGRRDEDGPRPRDRYGPDVPAARRDEPARRARHMGAVRGANVGSLSNRSVVSGHAC